MSASGKIAHRKTFDFGVSSYSELLILLLKGSLHSQLPSPLEFRPPIQSFYSQAFQVYHIRQEKELANHHQSTSNHASSTPNGGHGGFQGTILMHDDSSTCSNSR